MPVADTIVSDDGQVLVVERFDIDLETGERKGFEDIFSMLGFSPDVKYEFTWERVVRLTRDYVEPQLLRQANEQLAITLLLKYATENADCHAKNLGFICSRLNDVTVASVYNMLIILAYDQYSNNPPGIYIDGRRSWGTKAALWRYLQQHLGIDPSAQRALVDQVC